MPRVSVLTPIYNTKPQYLRECIESILNQTFKDFEFLILNDSPDNKEIEKIVKDYASKDKRIKYYKNDKNMGIAKSRNKLLDLASGEYIAVFDHDDISLPERLEKQVKYLDENLSIGVVSGWVQYFGDVKGIFKTPEHDAEIKICLTDNCYIIHTASMIRKSVLDENNIKYEEYYTPSEDYRLWTRLMAVTYFYNMQEVLVKYRCSKSNTTNRQKIKMDKMAEEIAFESRNKYPFYWQQFKRSQNRTILRLKLFGFIPLLKIKNNKVFLFECIPVMKIKYK